MYNERTRKTNSCPVDCIYDLKFYFDTKIASIQKMLFLTAKLSRNKNANPTLIKANNLLQIMTFKMFCEKRFL